MTHAVTPTSLGRVTDESRGAAVRARRDHLGMDKIDLADRAGVDRGKLGRFEAGKDQPSERWIARVERALDDFEHEVGFKPGEAAAEAEASSSAPAAPIRLTFHDVFGIGEIIAEGPSDKPDELIAAVRELFAELRSERDR
jgi:transcriptional regulator with XRE-family HTH domain